MTPTHEHVRAAVTKRADPEWDEWTKKPSQYVLREKKIGLKHHKIYFVIPTHLPYPMSFYLVLSNTGSSCIPTEAPGNVLQILAAEDSLNINQQACVAAELIRNHQQRVSVVTDYSQVTDINQLVFFFKPRTKGDRIEFIAAVDGAPLQHWSIDQQSFSTRTLPS